MTNVSLMEKDEKFWKSFHLLSFMKTLEKTLGITYFIHVCQKKEKIDTQCDIYFFKSIFWISHTIFSIFHLRTRPINLSTWMRVAAISKLFTIWISENYGLFFCEGWFKYIPLILPKSCIASPLSDIISCSSSTQFRTSDFLWCWSQR